MLRLRLGVILILASWFPFAQIGILIAHNQGHLTSNSSMQEFRLVIWSFQVIIGFIGLWLAGKIAVATVKHDGWRKAPNNLWHVFWNGYQIENSKK